MKRIIVAAVMTLAAIGIVPAHAEDPTCTVAAGTQDAAHVQDPVNDYDATLSGNQQGLPWGDVYGAGADLTNAWFTPTSKATTIQAHIGVQNLAGIETNVDFYFYWDRTIDDVTTTYYASAILNGRGGASYSIGFLDNTQAVPTNTAISSTTGSFTTGPNGGFAIDVPLKKVGNPVAGELLESPRLESRFLIGTGNTGGLLELIDDTTNADPVCSDGVTI